MNKKTGMPMIKVFWWVLVAVIIGGAIILIIK